MHVSTIVSAFFLLSTGVLAHPTVPSAPKAVGTTVDTIPIEHHSVLAKRGPIKGVGVEHVAKSCDTFQVFVEGNEWVARAHCRRGDREYDSELNLSKVIKNEGCVLTWNLEGSDASTNFLGSCRNCFVARKKKDDKFARLIGCDCQCRESEADGQAKFARTFIDMSEHLITNFGHLAIA